MTVREKAELIVKDIKKEQGTNPVVIFKQIAEKEYISIHGPEHHILDGASLLVAYKNAGGEIDLEQALDRLMAEGLRMPGAMCGLWGICGAITSLGAALAIIDGTGPLSTDGTWGNHMQFTSKAIGELGTINGPRCCKRDAMIAFKNGIDFNIWDSISTINGDIDSLIKEITSTRRKFTSENLTIPYRNGILHGIDVGYGNKSVAVKAWALLFTIRDILVDKRNEESERTKYDKQQKKEQEEFLSFVENSIKYINGVLDYANSFYNWKPSRTQSQWDMLIKTGLPQDFPENSPEQCIISFLYGWKISNYGLMADLVHRKNDTTKGMLAGQLRWSLKTKSLLDYQIDFIQEERGGIVFGTTITFAERGIELNKDICLIVDYYIDGKKSYCSGGSGKWLLNDVIIPMLCYLPTQGEETP